MYAQHVLSCLFFCMCSHASRSACRVLGMCTQASCSACALAHLAAQQGSRDNRQEPFATLSGLQATTSGAKSSSEFSMRASSARASSGWRPFSSALSRELKQILGQPGAGVTTQTFLVSLWFSFATFTSGSTFFRNPNGNVSKGWPKHGFRLSSQLL